MASPADSKGMINPSFSLAVPENVSEVPVSIVDGFIACCGQRGCWQRAGKGFSDYKRGIAGWSVRQRGQTQMLLEIRIANVRRCESEDT